MPAGAARSLSRRHGERVGWKDFLELAEDDRRELIEGELVEVEVPTKLHEHVVATLVILLGSWVRARRAGLVLASGYKVRIASRRGVMPDVQFFRRGNLPKGQEKGLARGRPDLAIEVVSSTSRRHDRVTKLGWYASIGVPEYWLVDPEARTFERLVLRRGHYAILDSLAGDAVARPGSFPGLTIDLAELWTVPED